MAKEDESKTAEENNEADVEETADTEEESQDESQEETETEADEIDYDSEIEKENKAGKPDPEIARKAFEAREKKRKETEGESEEDAEDKPLTRKDLEAVRAETRRQVQIERATELAKGLSGGNDKAAELIIARWNNRTFPEGTPLSDQIEEVYAGVHRKKLIGERNEALRGLKNKDNVNKLGAGSHREGLKPQKPKMKPQDEAAITAAGYDLNSTSGLYEKKLGNGDMLIYDAKTKKNTHVKKAS